MPTKSTNKFKIIIFFIGLMIVMLIALIILILFNNPLKNPNNTNQTSITPNTGGPTSSVLVTPGLDYSEDDYVYSGSAPVYVTIYSHNEDSWDGMVNTKIKYLDYRQGLLDRINLLEEFNIEWDWQSDQPVIEAMIKYENDSSVLASTNGKNILEYMEDLGVSLDPHAHNNNYADIAYLMTELGVQPSSVIGGTIVLECGDDYLGYFDFADWHKNIDLSIDSLVHGEDYPDATWDPKILSDPGMGQHFFDDWSSGVWKPGNLTNFYIQDNNSDIVYVGEGYPHDSTIIGPTHSGGALVYASDGQYIKELVQMIVDRELPTGTKDGKLFIYTASIHVRDKATVNESGSTVVTIDGLQSVLTELEPLRTNGQIIYATFEDVVEVWNDEYDSVPWKIDLSSFSFYDEVKALGISHCSSTVRK